MAVTATRGGMRLLAVVLGEDTAQIRNQETTELLDYGFQNYKLTVVKGHDEVLKEISLDKAKPDKMEIVLKEDITKLSKKGEDVPNYEFELKLDDIKLPIKKGDTVGYLILKQNGDKLEQYPVTVKSDIKKLSFLRVFSDLIGDMIAGK